MIKYILIFLFLATTVNANLIGGYSFRYDGYNQEGGVQVKANGNDGVFANASAGDYNGSTDFVTVSSNGNDTVLFAGDSFVEIVENGTFDSDLSWWTGSTLWSWESDGSGGGRASHGVAGTNSIYKTGVVSVNSYYVYSFEVGGYTAGDIKVRIGSGGNGVTRNANGTYIETKKCLTNTDILCSTVVPLQGRIDNVSVRQIDALWELSGLDFNVGKSSAQFFTGQIPWFITYDSSDNIPDATLQQWQLDPQKALIYGADVWVWDNTIDNYINLQTYSEGVELIVNGDFSDGTNDWLAQNNAALSVESGALRVSKNGASTFPFAVQTVTTIGLKYIVDAEIRGDSTALPNVKDGSVTVITGTSSNTWQAVRASYIATATGFILLANTAGGGAYSEFDNVSVKQVPATSVATNTGVSDTTTGGTPLYNFWRAGFKGLEFDGVDDYIDIGDLGVTVNTMYIVLDLNTTSESLVDLDGGTHTLLVNSGTISANGFASPTIYVDGVETSTITIGKHVIAINTATGIDVDNFDIGRISASYGSYIGYSVLGYGNHNQRQIKHNTEVLKRWYRLPFS